MLGRCMGWRGGRGEDGDGGSDGGRMGMGARALVEAAVSSGDGCVGIGVLCIPIVRPVGGAGLAPACQCLSP